MTLLQLFFKSITNWHIDCKLSLQIWSYEGEDHIGYHIMSALRAGTNQQLLVVGNDFHVIMTNFQDQINLVLSWKPWRSAHFSPRSVWNHRCSFPCCLVATEPRRGAFQRGCSRENLPNKLPSHFRYWNESLCVSLQSFLVLRDSATSQPSLLCVSAGGENEAVLDYNIKSTDTGTDQPHADTLAKYFLFLCVAICVTSCHFVTLSLLAVVLWLSLSSDTD